MLGGASMQKVVSLEEAFGSFDERWSPRIIAQVNDYDLKVVHVAGEFVWHDHPGTDEFFLVTAGRLVIDLDDPDRPSQVVLGPGELFVVPRGVRHRPIADEGTRLLLLEPRGTVNTGEAHDGTAGVPWADERISD
jgi:mannose-6-phosphate isomerase-like protein (cupin superfamily)